MSHPVHAPHLPLTITAIDPTDSLSRKRSISQLCFDVLNTLISSLFGACGLTLGMFLGVGLVVYGAGLGTFSLMLHAADLAYKLALLYLTCIFDGAKASYLTSYAYIQRLRPQF